MPIYTKKSDGTWSTNAKKVFVKAADGLWKSATRVFAKTINGWVQMWPGDAPAVNQNDPINIRSGGYNGTVVSSPQYINAVLYGHDGNGSSITGATPITITNRNMKISEDDTGQTTRYTLETVDIYDLTNNSETNIGYKRFMADNWYLFYQLDATNVWGTSTLYSYPPVKIIRQAPTFTSGSPTFSADYTFANPTFSFAFSFSDTWWKAADLSSSYIRWWQNTSKTPGGTILKTTYIGNIPGLATNRSGSYSDYNGTGITVSGTDSYTANGGVPSGQYIIAEIVLINSYTLHYNSPVSTYKTTGDNPLITALSIKDDNGNGVINNELDYAIMSDGYLNFTATVTGATGSTYYLLEPRIYNWQTGAYYEYNTTTVIGSSSFPTDLTPTSTSLNGDTATITWRTYIDANTLYGMGGPTYSSGQHRWQLEFRVSARASSSTPNSSASYFTGIADLGSASVYLQGIDIPGMIDISPSSVMELGVSSSNTFVGDTITFNITTTSYPSGYASYPRRYKLDYGDGTSTGWVSFSSGTSNPSVTSLTKSYNSTGTYNAVLYWDPQGDPTRSSFRSRSISVSAQLSPATSTSISSVSRVTDSSVQTVINSSGASGPYWQLYWTTASSPVVTSVYDAASTTSTVTDIWSPSANYTYYFYIRSSNENLGNTTVSGNGSTGTYSSYGPSTGAANYYFTSPSGGSVSSTDLYGSTISSIISGNTIYLSKSSPSASPAATGEIIVWRRADGGVGGNSFTGGSIRQNGGTSYTTLSGDIGYSIRPEITWNNGIGSILVNGNAVTVTQAPPGSFTYYISETTSIPSTPYWVSSPYFSGTQIIYDWSDTTNTIDWFSDISGGPEGYRSNYRSVSNDFWSVTGGNYYNVSVYARNTTTSATIYFGPSSNAGSYTVFYSVGGSPTSQTTTSTSITIYTSQQVIVTGVTAYINTNGTGASTSGSLTGTDRVTPSAKTSGTLSSSNNYAPIIQYTVTWNANGGSVSPSSNTVNSGSSVTAPTPTRSGYSFNGWYNASSGGSYIVGAGSSYTVTSNITLYAQWTSTFITPSASAPALQFQRTTTALRWYCDYPSTSGSVQAIVSMQFQISTTASTTGLLIDSTRAYPGAGVYPYSAGGTIWAFRCGSSDGDIAYSSSARYGRARVVMTGTNGSTYYGTWSGWL